ncbi:hypothetical protein DPX16_21796 [Anabarilius grahami]|uniref:Uncharacterized protein n=1 Tax=Anabarilius grahami TaxID=495550 RepID=A0A3N0Z4Z5_ANAGA|nr:hypothetical protein DPX16_21796 [Anabarilius grahami]
MFRSSSRGIRPSASTREDQTCPQVLTTLRQRDMEVRAFTQKFWSRAERFSHSDAVLKDIFNHCLDDPLPQWEMELVRSLNFWNFSNYLYLRKNGQVRIPPAPAPAHQSAPEPAPAHQSAPEPAPAHQSSPARESAPEPAPARESAAAPTEEVGTEPPPHPHKRRKRRKKASSIPQGPEAVPEPAVGLEDTPEVLEPNALPVSPVMAKRAVFAFYVLAVLRAWKMHLSSFDHGPVCQPESRPRAARSSGYGHGAPLVCPDGATQALCPAGTTHASSSIPKPAGARLVRSSSTALALSQDSRPAGARLVSSSRTDLARHPSPWSFSSPPPS